VATTATETSLAPPTMAQQLSVNGWDRNRLEGSSPAHCVLLWSNSCVSDYRDRWIECTDTEVQVHGYYFPWGTKRIPYSSIRSVERFTMTALRGKGRIWGSGDLRHWANLDPRRPGKSVGFFLNVGRRVIPFLTPDDPDAFEQVLRGHGAPVSTA
jgi:hypothetical protein